MKKETVLQALSTFAHKRPGLDFADYGDRTNYSAEARRIARSLADFRQLYRAVELSSGITAEDLQQASRRAFCGRLSLVERENGDVAVKYCTGQYWPTEYRNAACAVLASALWNYRSVQCMPEPVYKQHGSAENAPMLTEATYNGLSAGDWLRRAFRKEYGRGIASRWFN